MLQCAVLEMTYDMTDWLAGMGPMQLSMMSVSQWGVESTDLYFPHLRSRRWCFQDLRSNLPAQAVVLHNKACQMSTRAYRTVVKHALQGWWMAVKCAGVGLLPGALAKLRLEAVDGPRILLRWHLQHFMACSATSATPVGSIGKAEGQNEPSCESSMQESAMAGSWKHRRTERDVIQNEN